MRTNFLKYIVFLSAAFALVNCSKNDGSSGGGGNNGGGGGGGNTDSNCIISTISQVNSGVGLESSLNMFYNSGYKVIKLVNYDSISHTKTFEADLNYIMADSIVIDQYEYLILDASGRVIRFKTKSDLADPVNSDDYLFQYSYNTAGYLSARNLYINSSSTPELSTVYTYTNNLLTSCVQIATSSGNLKVLEATLSYNTSLRIKNWIYTFPDATTEYMYMTGLNFGNRCSYPVKQIVTKIYDPPSGTLLDTWVTNYNNYKTDGYGHIISGEADGDLQQGIATFYGKTNFYYDCH